MFLKDDSLLILYSDGFDGNKVPAALPSWVPTHPKLPGKIWSSSMQKGGYVTMSHYLACGIAPNPKHLISCGSTSQK